MLAWSKASRILTWQISLPQVPTRAIGVDAEDAASLEPDPVSSFTISLHSL